MKPHGSDDPRRPNLSLSPTELQVRVHGPAGLPTIIYLPGIHGDWTLIGSYRAAVLPRVRFVEFVYPHTTDWSLEDYARAVLARLESAGIREGWLLGESFGSQVLWSLLAKASPSSSRGTPDPPFRPQGVILAAGFVHHPIPPLVRLAEWLFSRVPYRWLQWAKGPYRVYSRFRHRHAPETLSQIEEFLERRTDPDRRAAVHRLHLIHSTDLRPVARDTELPVYYLAGLVDPVVPWPAARRWLQLHCPGYRGGHTILSADHNVLATAPESAAQISMAWIGLD